MFNDKRSYVENPEARRNFYGESPFVLGMGAAEGDSLFMLKEMKRDNILVNRLESSQYNAKSPDSEDKPKMVNAPEGLNQVILRKVRRFRSFVCQK